METLRQENLNNLNHFWRALSASQQGEYNLHPQWPYKQWLPDFSFALPAELSRDQVLVTAEDRFELNDAYVVKGHLVMMSLAVENAPVVMDIPATNFEWLANVDAIKQWVSVCSLAFGYEVDASVMTRVLDDPNAFILAYYSGNTLSGTGVGYRTGNTFGIHQLGTLPEFRGQGIARKMMHILLGKAQALGCDHVSLQASEAGLPLYQQLGFEPLGKVTSIIRS